MSEKLEELISLLYQDKLTQYGKRLLVENIEKLQKENEELRAKWDKDTHILQNKLDYANADRIDLAQQNKELRKENEELKFEERSRIIGKYGDAEIHDVINRTLSNDYIPIQKIKAKIEELDIAISECIYLDDDDEEYKKAVKKDKLCLLNQKRALQELLEEGDLE